MSLRQRGREGRKWKVAAEETTIDQRLYALKVVGSGARVLLWHKREDLDDHRLVRRAIEEDLLVVGYLAEGADVDEARRQRQLDSTTKQRARDHGVITRG